MTIAICKYSPGVLKTTKGIDLHGGRLGVKINGWLIWIRRVKFNVSFLDFFGFPGNFAKLNKVRSRVFHLFAQNTYNYFREIERYKFGYSHMYRTK